MKGGEEDACGFVRIYRSSHLHPSSPLHLLYNTPSTTHNKVHANHASLTITATPLPPHRSAAYMMILMYEESIKDCDSALNLDPTNTKVYFRKAKLQVNLGLLEEGIDTYAKGLVRDSNNVQAVKEKDQAVMAQKRMQLAKDCLKKYDANLQKIEGRQALSQVEIVLGICPGWKEAKLIKCLALSAAGRGDEAYGLTTSLMRGGMMNNSELLFVRAR